jgi:large subunit ribosomal protein L18
MDKNIRRQKIRYKIRKKVSGTAEAPRLAVFRSNAEIYAQVIDDINGKTLFAASSLEKAFTKEKANKTELAKIVGKAVGERALQGGISNVKFDRSGYLYHGRVKAVAEGAREAGLKF